MLEKKSLFVIGDSIASYYGPYLKKMVNPIFNYGQIAKNGGDSSMVLEYLKEQLREIEKYGVLLFNCGLHDIKTNPRTKKRQVNIQKYKKNLNTILGLMSKIGVSPIWVNTTPVEDKRHNVSKEFKRYNKDVVKYNKIAERIMKESKVAIIDLYTFTKNLGKDVYCDGVHFKEKVRVLQAAFIAGNLFAKFK